MRVNIWDDSQPNLLASLGGIAFQNGVSSYSKKFASLGSTLKGKKMLLGGNSFL